MRENYLKGFFKTFGLIPLIIALFAFIYGGYIALVGNVISGQLQDVVGGIFVVVVAGLGIMGLSGLKGEKIGFLDFARVIAFVAGLVLAIMVIANDGKKVFAVALFAGAGLALIEMVIRFISGPEYDENASFRNYYGTLAGKFNPLIILVVGTIVAFGIIILAKNNITDKIDMLSNFKSFKYAAVGGAVGIFILALLIGLDKNTDVNLMDFLFAVFFVGGSFATIMIVPKSLSSTQVQLMVFVFAAANAIVLLLRAFLYNSGKGYTNPAHKVRTYFKSVYDKYDITFPLLICMILFGAVLFAAAKFYGDKKYIVNLLMTFGFRNGASIVNIIAVVIGVIGVLLTFVFRKFKSKEVVRTDDVLVGLLFGSTMVLAYCLSTLLFTDYKFLDETSNLVLLIAFGVIFLYSVILQFVRLKNFEPLQAFVSAAEEKAAQEEAKEEEAQAEEEAQEEKVQEEEPEEENDPFALTEEDEELFNSYYGNEVEEEPQEEVQEEVVEEEPVEEVVEEVVEEPTEEVVEEEAAEETEEEYEEEETEEEDEEEAQDEYEALEDEEIIPVEVHKEQNILVQEFQVLDENGEPRKIKKKFLTKMMYAPYETKEYYNEVKNYLGLYRAKGRQSARCESFRYKGLVAKVALGGKSLKVFLAIDPSFIDENPKYHLRDVSEKKQYAEVPVMMKIRSQRALKYFKELVDYMFANRGVKPKRNFEQVDYLPSLIPNGEAILASLGMSTYYLQDTMNAKGIPDEMPDNLGDYLPMIPGEPLEEEEVEAVVYLDTLCNHFESGDEITIDILKSLHVVTRGNVLRIKARGTLDRKLIIYAEYFDEDAIKMIMCTNCTAIKIVR